MTNILIAIAAGCAAALMFASVVSGAMISVVLAYLSPLPLLVAALGWGPASALIGGVSAGVGLGLMFNFVYGLGFILTIATPAFWLGHLALLARPAAQPAAVASDPQQPSLDWYPIGRILLWAALMSVAVMAFAVLSIGSGDEEILGRLKNTARAAVGQFNPKLSVDEMERAANFIARVLPMVAVGSTMLMYLLNLWLAAKITATSGRLRRPWPTLSDITVPQSVLIALAAALTLSFAGGTVALLAQIVSAALLTAYMLVGFAVLHAITPYTGARWWLLTAAYGAVVFFMWPALLVMLLGLVESVVGLRQRFANRQGPPTLST